MSAMTETVALDKARAVSGQIEELNVQLNKLLLPLAVAAVQKDDPNETMRLLRAMPHSEVRSDLLRKHIRRMEMDYEYRRRYRSAPTLEKA